MKRDLFIDYLRGLCIVWMIIVHAAISAGVKGFFPPDLTNAISPTVPFIHELGAMSVFFFVSGVALYYSYQRQPSDWLYLSRRLRRLVVPYLWLAVACITLYYSQKIWYNQDVTWDHAVSWLIAKPYGCIPYLVDWYVWFIRVVILVSIAHVVLIRFFASDRLRLPAAVALLAGIALPTILLPGALSLPRSVIFYGFFVYLGYYYASGRLRLRPIFLAIICVSSLASYYALAWYGIVSFNTYFNKFPPNLGYALLGMFGLTLCLLMRPGVLWICKRYLPIASVLVFISDHSYEIYLWQAFGFLGTDLIVDFTPIADIHYSVRYFIYFVLSFGITVLLIQAKPLLLLIIRRISQTDTSPVLTTDKP